MPSLVFPPFSPVLSPRPILGPMPHNTADPRASSLFSLAADTRFLGEVAAPARLLGEGALLMPDARAFRQARARRLLILRHIPNLEQDYLMGHGDGGDNA